MTKQVLISTLGTEPQVVTLVLDLLEEKGYAIGEVIVVHIAGQAVRRAINLLQEEIAARGSISYRLVPVTGEKGTAKDIVTEGDIAALLRTLYRLVLDQKRAGRSVHLSIAGGRKPMAVCGMVVAQLLFDDSDHVWHLLTEGW